MKQPPAVEQRFRAARAHVAAAADRAIEADPAAYRLMAVTEEACLWLASNPQAWSGEHPAARYVQGNYWALVAFLMKDVGVTRWLTPAGVENLLAGHFASIVFGADAVHGSEFGLTFRQLLPDQRVKFVATDEGQPALMVMPLPGAKDEERMLDPVVRWSSLVAGFSTEQRGHPSLEDEPDEADASTWRELARRANKLKKRSPGLSYKVIAKTHLNISDSTLKKYRRLLAKEEGRGSN